MLMLDRYLVGGGRALDLATGASIRWHARRTRARMPPLFTVRGKSWLIDFDLRRQTRIEVWEPFTGSTHEESADTVAAFRAALSDAHDGRPRALDLAEPSLEKWLFMQRVLAREARLAGFVPLAADVFGALLSQAHWRWPAFLKDRAIVVFATDTRLSPDATIALFKLAMKDARPHLIVRGVTSELWRPRLIASAITVHESPPAEPVESVETLVQRADALTEGGQFVDAEAAARWSMLLSESGDQSPARCALARSLIGQRRLFEARAALAPLETVEATALRESISRRAAQPGLEPAMVESFLEILRTCQDHEDPATALARVAIRLNHALGAAAIAFVIADRSRPIVVAHAGAFSPSASQLAGASRVLDTGVAVPSSARGPSEEAAWPIRYGATVVGALWCHWSVGVPLIPEDVASLLGLAATAAAPAVHEVRERLRSPEPTTALIPDLIGESAAMQIVRSAVLKAAASPFPVLIEGESGSGKELVARAIHASSVRRARRYCALNCAAIADELVEAELFGHTRGAFTGAIAERVGMFEECQGGTLFLDEVAELSARKARCAVLANPAHGASMRESWRPRIARSKARSAPAGSAMISAIASTSCESTFRPFASGSKTSRCSFDTYGRCWQSERAAVPCSRRPRCRCSAPTTGPATSASCRTCWPPPWSRVRSVA
jgi:hypothetical protein